MAGSRSLHALVVALCACATSDDPFSDPINNSIGSVDDGGESTTGPAGTTMTTVGDASDADAEAGEVEESTSGAPGEESTSDTTSDGGSSSAGSESTGEAPMCINQLTCPTADVIGEVSGDEDSAPIEVQGADPTWVTFQVTEDNDSALGENVSFSATLLSPDGFDFDLYVYRGPSGGATGCNGDLQQSTSAGSSDVVHMSWGEGAVANGVDDRAWVAVEIRPKDDMCDPTALWTLTIEGDT